MNGAVEGVVLAAGRSARMQRSKPALMIDSVTFAERAVSTLREAGCARVLLVVAEEADWVDAVAENPAVSVVRNPDRGAEQIDSVRLALEHVAPDSAAVLVLPVDLPLISVDTAAAVVRAHREDGSRLVLPFHNGVAGHPVLLSRALFGAIRDGEWEEGLRSLIMTHAHELKQVIVNDPGILIDIDTPEQYRRFIGRS